MNVFSAIILKASPLISQNKITQVHSICYLVQSRVTALAWTWEPEGCQNSNTLAQI